MARRPSANSKPGTERYRDERRKDDKPKMHGQQWHDHAQPKNFEPEPMAGAGAILGEPIEGSPNNSVAGMGRVKRGKETSRGGVKRKRQTPIGKQHKATKPVQGSRSGMKSRNRAGNPG